MFLFKRSHKIDKGGNRLKGRGIVNRCPAPADGSVSLETTQAAFNGIFDKCHLQI